LCHNPLFLCSRQALPLPSASLPSASTTG